MIIMIQLPGGNCEFDTESKDEAVAEYQDDVKLEHGFGYLISVHGDHKGAPINVIVTYPKWEYDGDGWGIDWGKITYEDGKQIDDIVDETYHDAIIEEVRNSLQGG